MTHYLPEYVSDVAGGHSRNEGERFEILCKWSCHPLHCCVLPAELQQMGGAVLRPWFLLAYKMRNAGLTKRRDGHGERLQVPRWVQLAPVSVQHQVENVLIGEPQLQASPVVLQQIPRLCEQVLVDDGFLVQQHHAGVEVIPFR